LDIVPARWTRFAKHRCVSTNGNLVDLNPAIRPSFSIIAFLRQGRCLFAKGIFCASQLFFYTVRYFIAIIYVYIKKEKTDLNKIFIASHNRKLLEFFARSLVLALLRNAKNSGIRK